MAEANKGVVFDLAVSSRESWRVLLGNIRNLRNALGADLPVEVVAYSKGIDFLVSDDIEIRSEIDALSAQGVAFYTAKTCMLNRGLRREDLNPKAQVADSGVAEVVRRQMEGWVYVKVSHY